MYIICIESSITRGMGHFFRALLYASYLKAADIPFLILINNDKNAIKILREKNIPFRKVDFSDESDWETSIAKECDVKVWIQDKYETSQKMANNIKKNNLLLCAIDDYGQGAELCDIHFSGMMHLTGKEAIGKKVFSGIEYVILNPEINKYSRVRRDVSKVIVSLGGSDPHGVTVDVIKQLKKTDYLVDIVIGPDFSYQKDLDKVNNNNYPVLQNVPSLIEEFSKHDFAITGGGVTCCEANACGIPCIIIANAPHEEHTGTVLQSMGSSVYAGTHENWNKDIISTINSLEIEKMSLSGMQIFDTRAVERIFSIIEQELENEGR